MTLRMLVAESEPPNEREERRNAVGKSSGETFAALLRELAPEAAVIQAEPLRETVSDLDGYDAVFLSGSPLHLYHQSEDNRRIVSFMRAVFDAGVPSFGSCAGLQIATVAAGGTVREMPDRLEAGFGRRITKTEAGTGHAMLAGRPPAYDAPAVHSDEVERLPDRSTLLASNAATTVQAAEIRSGAGIFWGVQYHPELTLFEVAVALRRQAGTLIAAGLAEDEVSLTAHAEMIDALGRDPSRDALAWRLGLDREVTRGSARTTEIRSFIENLVRPTASRRHRERRSV